MINENSPYYLKEIYPVRYSEVDYNECLKPSAMFNFLQDMATNGADAANFGYKDIHPKNLGWYLLKYHMEFSNYPVKAKNLIFKTEARGYNKIFAHRDFEIYSEDNNLMGRVLSYWTLVDINTKAMVCPGDIFEQFKKVEKREDDLSFVKVKELERVDYAEEFKIRFDDIDVNGHANNANYIIWAFESLPKEFRDNHKLKTLDIVYKKEISFYNKVLSEIQIENNFTRHSVKNKSTGEELCLVNAEFIEY